MLVFDELDVDNWNFVFLVNIVKICNVFLFFLVDINCDFFGFLVILVLSLVYDLVIN